MNKIKSSIHIVLLATLFLLLIGGNEYWIVQYHRVISKTQIVEDQKSIVLPTNWSTQSLQQHQYTLLGYPKNNRNVFLDLTLYTNDLYIVNDSESCVSGYTDYFENNNGIRVEVLVCAIDKDKSKKPYMTIFLRDINLSLTSQNYKPYYYESYLDVINNISMH